MPAPPGLAPSCMLCDSNNIRCRAASDNFGSWVTAAARLYGSADGEGSLAIIIGLEIYLVKRDVNWVQNKDKTVIIGLWGRFYLGLGTRK